MSERLIYFKIDKQTKSLDFFEFARLDMILLVIISAACRCLYTRIRHISDYRAS